MLNKILRIIIGMPIITFIYVVAFVMNVIIFCGFVTHDWVRGDLDLNLYCRIFGEMIPLSPYQFVKEVWKD